MDKATADRFTKVAPDVVAAVSACILQTGTSVEIINETKDPAAFVAVMTSIAAAMGSGLGKSMGMDESESLALIARVTYEGAARCQEQAR